MAEKLYTDEFAEMLKRGEKYRPANGAEGALFMARFCDRCRRDAAFRDGSGDSCPIVVAAMVNNADDPDYPAEWQIGEDGQPKCTAFEPDGEAA